MAARNRHFKTDLKSVDVPRFSESVFKDVRVTPAVRRPEGKHNGVRVIWLYGDALRKETWSKTQLRFQTMRMRVIVDTSCES